MNNPTEVAAGTHRVFFALWPDDATRSAIARAARAAVQACGGRPIAKDRFHLTVAFLGELTDPGVRAALAVPPVSTGPFDLTLDAVGVWPESKVLWLAPLTPPEALGELEATLSDGLAAQGFRMEDRIYRPHVTLARRARPIEAAVEPVTWRVSDLVLVESFPAGNNVHYEVLERWPL